MKSILQFIEDNQALLTLLTFLIALPAFGVLLWGLFQKLPFLPKNRTKRFKNDAEHARRLKKEVEDRTNWHESWGYFGEFIIRDGSGKLPETEESHSQRIATYSTAVLHEIHREYLVFTNGTFGIREIKYIGDSWYYAEHKDPEAIKVYTLFRVNYRDIEWINWEVDDYWEWPQVVCRFRKRKTFPLSRTYFGEKKKSGDRFVFKEICEFKDVSNVPAGLAEQDAGSDVDG